MNGLLSIRILSFIFFSALWSNNQDISDAFLNALAYSCNHEQVHEALKGVGIRFAHHLDLSESTMYDFLKLCRIYRKLCKLHDNPELRSLMKDFEEESNIIHDEVFERRDPSYFPEKVRKEKEKIIEQQIEELLNSEHFKKVKKYEEIEQSAYELIEKLWPEGSFQAKKLEEQWDKELERYSNRLLLMVLDSAIESLVARLESAPDNSGRKSMYPIEDLILHRTSKRALSGELITDSELHQLFEAARWAPSSFNSQPWRFIYAKKDSAHWDTLFNLLVPFNKQWAKNAGALIIIVSKNTFDHNGKFSRTHSFDTGAAWQNLALQGHAQGLIVHGMSGFDYEKAKEVLKIPDDYTIEAMCAVGKPGKIKMLSKELQKGETPSSRKPITEFICEGVFHE